MITLTILEILKQLRSPFSSCYWNILQTREFKITQRVSSVYRYWSPRKICAFKQVSHWQKHYCPIYSACLSKRGEQRMWHWHSNQGVSEKPALLGSTDGMHSPQRTPPSHNSEPKTTDTHHCPRRERWCLTAAVVPRGRARRHSWFETGLPGSDHWSGTITHEFSWMFQLNMRKNFFTLGVTECWGRLPGGVVESPSLEIFKTRLDKVLCSLLWVTLLQQGAWIGGPTEVPSNPKHSVNYYQLPV